MWVCECGKVVESRTKYLLHKGTCKTEDVSLKKCDLQDCSFQNNLQESACTLPISYEESFCDLMPSIEREFTVDSEITITNNESGAQMTELLSPPAKPISLPENLITCSQKDVLPVIDVTRSDVNIILEEEFIVDNTVNVTISTESCEQQLDYTSTSVEEPTRPTKYNELVSDTLCDIPQVSKIRL